MSKLVLIGVDMYVKMYSLSLSFRLSPTVLVDYVDTPINLAISLSFRLSPTVLVDYVDTPINLAISQSDTREGISLRRPAYSSASKLFIPFFESLGPEPIVRSLIPLMFVLIFTSHINYYGGSIERE